MLKIRNVDLVELLNFLTDVELTPKVSRVRSKLIKLIQEKIEELYKDEIELLNKYGKKDEEGSLVQHEGTFSLLEETAVEYHKEKSVLLEEKTAINVDELHERLPILITGLENNDIKLSGKKADTLDLLLDLLENELNKNT